MKQNLTSNKNTFSHINIYECGLSCTHIYIRVYIFMHMNICFKCVCCSRELNCLNLQEDFLYRRRQDGEKGLFTASRAEISGPGDMGHLGIERTLDLVPSLFFWLPYGQGYRNQDQHLCLLCETQGSSRKISTIGQHQGCSPSGAALHGRLVT